MNKYINTFANSGDYETYKASSAFTTPNVAYLEDSKEVKWLNSKKDLYNIYGTLIGDSAKAIIVLNGNKTYTIRAIDGNEYGFNFPIEVNSFRIEGNNANKIRTIDKLVFNTNSLAGMSFTQCESLTNIDLSRVDTSRFTDMREMFNDCQVLTTLDLSNWNTSKVMNMRLMFSSCYALTSLDLSNFDTSAVTNMEGMFDNCRALTSLDVSNFNTSAVTVMSGMFSNCRALTNLDVSNLNTSGVTNMGSMFSGCYALTSLDLSNFDTSAVTDMSNMFKFCYALTTVTMNNTNQTTFGMIKARLVSDSVASHVTIIRDGHSYTYNGSEWVEA